MYLVSLLSLLSQDWFSLFFGQMPAVFHSLILWNIFFSLFIKCSHVFPNYLTIYQYYIECLPISVVKDYILLLLSVLLSERDIDWSWRAPSIQWTCKFTLLKFYVPTVKNTKGKNTFLVIDLAHHLLLERQIIVDKSISILIIAKHVDFATINNVGSHINSKKSLHFIIIKIMFSV